MALVRYRSGPDRSNRREQRALAKNGLQSVLKGKKIDLDSEQPIHSIIDVISFTGTTTFFWRARTRTKGRTG